MKNVKTYLTSKKLPGFNVDRGSYLALVLGFLLGRTTFAEPLALVLQFIPAQSGRVRCRLRRPRCSGREYNVGQVGYLGVSRPRDGSLNFSD